MLEVIQQQLLQHEYNYMDHILDIHFFHLHI